jgi:hypothetical protein
MEEYSSQVVAYEYTEIESLSGNREYIIGPCHECAVDASGSLPIWVNILYFVLFILGASLVCYLGWNRF